MHTPQPDFLLDHILDHRYRIDSFLAAGGTAQVYIGYDTRLDRPVAIKVIHHNQEHTPEFRRRFRKEAQAIARMHHPGIVHIYDYNSTFNLSYIVMELIIGGTIRELLYERGPMPPYAIASIAIPLLTAIGYAHKQGVVHRDIKPDNIMINTAGEVKITDFGLIKTPTSDEIGLTSTHTIMGTAAYMSPEQVTGGTITPASDVYSLGITFYEMLTGQLPFTGKNTLEIAYKRITQDTPAMSSIIEGIDPAIEAYIATATHRDSTQRYQDATIMLEVLQEIAHEHNYDEWEITPPQHTLDKITYALQSSPPISSTTLTISPHQYESDPIASYYEQHYATPHSSEQNIEILPQSLQHSPYEPDKEESSFICRNHSPHSHLSIQARQAPTHQTSRPKNSHKTQTPVKSPLSHSIFWFIIFMFICIITGIWGFWLGIVLGERY